MSGDARLKLEGALVAYSDAVSVLSRGDPEDVDLQAARENGQRRLDSRQRVLATILRPLQLRRGVWGSRGVGGMLEGSRRLQVAEQRKDGVEAADARSTAAGAAAARDVVWMRCAAAYLHIGQSCMCCAWWSSALAAGCAASWNVKERVEAVISAWMSPRMRGTSPWVPRASERLPGRRRSSCESVLRQARRADGEASQRAATLRRAQRTMADAASCWWAAFVSCGAAA